MRRLAASLAALLLAPAIGSAELPPGTYFGPNPQLVSYALSGCDYSHADVFGPGPRACATGVLTYDTEPGPQGFVFYDIRIVGATGYAFNLGQGGYVNPIVPGGGTDNDGGYPSRCDAVVCRGVLDYGLGANGVLLSGTTAFPTSAYINLRYFADSVATGTPFDFSSPPDLAGSIILTGTVIPEPSTVALTLGGLAVLGAGAWRRRRA